jgi:Asp/Glu/hydantoin racemase
MVANAAVDVSRTLRDMRTILLLNPNTSARSLRMMMQIAASELPPGVAIRGISAAFGVKMIVNQADLLASARAVARIGAREAPDAAAIVVSAFGDPGVETLWRAVHVPVVGIGTASIAEAGRADGVLVS